MGDYERDYEMSGEWILEWERTRGRLKDALGESGRVEEGLGS